MIDKRKLSVIIILHFALVFYSVSGILSKLAAGTVFLSISFCLYYAGIIIILGVYAIVWQQIIKRLPLTVAFANKAVTVLWGIVWGILFFDELINTGKIIGALVIIIGIVLYSTDKEVINDT